MSTETHLRLWDTAYLMRRGPQLAGRLRCSLAECNRAVRKGLLSTWREIGTAIPRYLRRSYHPSQGRLAAAARRVSDGVTRGTGRGAAAVG